MKDTTVSIPDHVAVFIEEEVRAGHYASASDVVHAALRLLQEQAAQLDQLRAALIEGEESGDPEPFDNEAFKARMRAQRAAAPAAAK